MLGLISSNPAATILGIAAWRKEEVSRKVWEESTHLQKSRDEGKIHVDWIDQIHD